MTIGATALIVEDEPLNRALLVRLLQIGGYTTLEAGDGEEGWRLLHDDAHDVSVVLLDHYMPVRDGMELLRMMKDDEATRFIPVCMITARDEPEFIAQCIALGVFYYIPKPFQTSIVQAVADSAVSHYRRKREMRLRTGAFLGALATVRRAEFVFQTIDEARHIAQTLGDTCPGADSLGFGLMELMLNAVEHGNLEISHQTKEELLRAGTLPEEIERRCQQAPYAERRVVVLFERRPNEAVIVIRDEGPGFDWRPFMTLDMDRIFAPHGRGIMMARLMSFSSLEYRGRGNEVEARARL